LERPGTGEPPLVAWPRTEEGKPVESLAFSFLRANQPEQKKLRASLTTSDRRLIKLLLEALPELARDQSAASADSDASAGPAISPRLHSFRKAAHAFSANGNGISIRHLFARS
jgi:hypothetical protein